MGGRRSSRDSAFFDLVLLSSSCIFPVRYPFLSIPADLWLSNVHLLERARVMRCSVGFLSFLFFILFSFYIDGAFSVENTAPKSTYCLILTIDLAKLDILIITTSLFIRLCRYSCYHQLQQNSNNNLHFVQKRRPSPEIIDQ